MPSNAFARISAAIRRPTSFDPADLSGSAVMNGGVVGTLTSISVLPGQVQYTTPGTYTWTVPTGVTSICVVCVGAGGGSKFYDLGGGVDYFSGGAGGSLGYKNNITVVPGTSYTVIVGAGGSMSGYSNGGFSRFGTILTAPGGVAGGTSLTAAATGADGGGRGGPSAYVTTQNHTAAGGGGAGGYSGNGGGGATVSGGTGSNGSGGGGAGGLTGYYSSSGGGGVGLLGEGASGTAPSGGGSGGTKGVNAGGSYGGGAAGRYSSTDTGGHGAVRIIWGTGRAFPSTNTVDV